MKQQMFEACLPWAVLAVAAVVAARILVWLSGARLQPARLRSIHNCESGSVQSLSFVLVLPFFVMVMLLILQASQLMIGSIVMQYAAYASARSASVWIPASVSEYESANCISYRSPMSATPAATGGTVSFAEFDESGWRFRVAPEGDKYSKILQAAVVACAPLGPSEDLGYSADGDTAFTQEALTKLYSGLDPDSVANGKIKTRIRSKIAYSAENTKVDLTFWHRFPSGSQSDRASNAPGSEWSYRPSQSTSSHRDPPLDLHRAIYQDGRLVGSAPLFEHNEVGWQDQITAKVHFNLPLLPGPMRFFAPQENSISIFDDPTPDGVTPDDADRDQTGNVFIWPITGVASLVNEGQKPVKRYWQEEF